MNSRLQQLWQVNKYLWMSLAFALLYIPIAEQRHLLRIPLWGAYALFSLGVVNGAARSILGYRHGGSFGVLRRNMLLISWMLTLNDIALISAGIWLSRGVASDFWLLYFIVVISESLYASLIQTRFIALTITLCYLAATLPYQWSASALPTFDYLNIVAPRLFFVILVGAYGRRLSYNATVKNNELTFLREQQAAGEERARIAREIHDGLGHALVSSILRLELCLRLLRKAPDEAEAILQEEIPALRAAWNEGRDLAFHLRPWELEMTPESTLPEALRRHIGRFAERTGIVVELKVEGEVGPLRPETAFGLTRLVQEALTNAAKHAQASRIEVTLQRRSGDFLICRVQDNGQGFDPEKPTCGVGLSAMRERAEGLGGHLHVESAPGEGTILLASLPDEGR